MKTLPNSHFSMLVLICLAAFLTACAPQAKIPKINAEYYPQCVKPFQDLAEAQKALVQRTIVSGVVGAAGGAAVGALVSGDWKGALAGGLIGGVSAGAVGYASGKQQQIKDVKARLASYRADMTTDIKNMSQVELYSMLSLQCYVREFKILLGSYRAHRILEADFKSHYAEIRNGMTQISTVLDDAYKQSVKREQEFRNALASERELAKAKPKENRTLAAAEQKRSRQTKAISKVKNINQMEQLIDNAKKDAEQNAAKQEAAYASAIDSQVSASLDSISSDFDTNYTANTARIASTKTLYSKSLDIMDEAASHAGIDMVYIPTGYYASLSSCHVN